MPNESARTKIIAEAGVNHNGSLEMALQLVDVAADAGADVVKFQTFRATTLVSRGAPKATYQMRSTGSEESQFEMLQRLELSADAHHELVAACRRRGIGFMSSPFDSDSLRFLVELGVDTIKLGSGELTNALLLIDAARSGRKLILSTGMATLSEVEEALSLISWVYAGSAGSPSRAAFRRTWADSDARAAVAARVMVLQCTTEYPANVAEVNLRAMKTLHDAFGVRVGLSDHTPGISVALGAAAIGASAIEKHFTLDKGLPGPDHQASLDPGELRALVAGVRDVEAAIGNGVKAPLPSEGAIASVARKSLVAARPIREGSVFTLEDFCAKRPAHGRSPFDVFDLIGKVSPRGYEADEVIDP